MAKHRRTVLETKFAGTMKPRLGETVSSPEFEEEEAARRWLHENWDPAEYYVWDVLIGKTVEFQGEIYRTWNVIQGGTGAPPEVRHLSGE